MFSHVFKKNTHSCQFPKTACLSFVHLETVSPRDHLSRGLSVFSSPGNCPSGVMLRSVNKQSLHRCRLETRAGYHQAVARPTTPAVRDDDDNSNNTISSRITRITLRRTVLGEARGHVGVKVAGGGGAAVPVHFTCLLIDCYAMR